MLTTTQTNLLNSLKEHPRSFASLSLFEQRILGLTLRPSEEGFNTDQIALMRDWRLIITETQLEYVRLMLDPGQGIEPLETLPLSSELTTKLFELGYLETDTPGQTILTIPASLLTDMRPGNSWFGAALILYQLPLIELTQEVFPANLLLED